MKIPVYCVETGEPFRSIRHFADVIGGEYRAVKRVLKGGGDVITFGLHFTTAERMAPEMLKKHPNARPLLWCPQTKSEYANVHCALYSKAFQHVKSYGRARLYPISVLSLERAVEIEDSLPSCGCGGRPVFEFDYDTLNGGASRIACTKCRMTTPSAPVWELAVETWHNCFANQKEK